VAPRLLIVLVLVAAAVAGLPAEAGAHGGVPGAGRDGGTGHASGALGTLLLLGVPAAGLVAGAVALRRAVRA
jgi:hypothetical protein